MSQAPKSERYFIGTVLAQRSDWEMFVSEPEATRSSKPESVAKEVADKRKKQEELAPFMPFTGTLVQFAILNTSGQCVFELTTCGKPGLASYQFVDALNQLFPPGEPVMLNQTPYDLGIRIFGLHIRSRIELIMADARRYAITHNMPLNTQPNLWYHKMFTAAPWADPYEIHVPSERRSDTRVDALCDFLLIPVPANLASDARVQAEVARQLTLKLPAFP